MARLTVTFSLSTNQGFFDYTCEVVGITLSQLTETFIMNELRPCVEGLLHQAAEEKEPANG